MAFFDVYPYTDVANQNASRVDTVKSASIRYFFRLWILNKKSDDDYNIGERESEKKYYE